MTICFFGIYDPTYARNRVLMQGFRALGWHIVECRINPQDFSGFSKYVALWRLWQQSKPYSYDLVLVAYPGHSIVPLARLLCGKQIIFDAFVSLYDSNVFDRKVHRPYSITAVLDWIRDWLSCSLAQVILLDTQEHIQYFVRTFSVSPKKCIRVLVGSDIQPNIQPTSGGTEKSTSIVHFHGTFIPLHGISFIVAAARLLQDLSLQFRLVGRGQEYERIQKEAEAQSLKNIIFEEPVPSDALPSLLQSADICLGIFGNTAKAKRVIPNKVFEYMAAGKPIITSDSPGIRELEIFGEIPMVLVPPANAEALADAIRFLHEQPLRRMQLSKEAFLFFKEHCTPVSIVQDLCTQLPSTVWRRGKEQLYLHHKK